MEETHHQGVIRKILRNDYAVIVTIAGVIFAFTTTVIVPIQKMQLQMAQVLEKIAKYDAVATQVTVINANIGNLTKQSDALQDKLEKHIEKTK